MRRMAESIPKLALLLEARSPAKLNRRKRRYRPRREDAVQPVFCTDTDVADLEFHTRARVGPSVAPTVDESIRAAACAEEIAQGTAPERDPKAAGEVLNFEMAV